MVGIVGYLPAGRQGAPDCGSQVLFLKNLKRFVVGIAQLVRAPDCGSGGRGFKSRYSPHMLPSCEPRLI